MSAPPGDAREMDALLQWIGSRTGLTFSAGRRRDAEVALHRAMTRRKTASLAELRAELDHDGSAFDDLVSDLTIGETYFFREPAQFAFIGREILPEIRARRGLDHKIRCWSAGCSSGEETYSLAILFGELGLLDRMHLVGTDVSRAALARALAATYRDWSFRGDDVARARRHFASSGDRHVLQSPIRDRVSFEYLNLALDTYPSFGNGIWGMDLILCRNVLIYFDRATISGVAQRLYASLAEGGWLVTASSDPPLAAEAPFEIVASDLGIFYRRTRAASAAIEPAARAWVRRDPDPSRAVDASANRRSTPIPFPTLPPTRAPRPQSGDVMGRARAAFARGEYAAVVDLTDDRTADPDAVALHVRALANLAPERALDFAAAAVRRHNLNAELHYLHASLLMELDRTREAAEAMRRVIYLDRALAIAHFSLGVILQRSGDLHGASRAFRNVRDLCSSLAPDTPLPLSDGENAGRVAAAAEAHLGMIERASRMDRREKERC